MVLEQSNKEDYFRINFTRMHFVKLKTKNEVDETVFITGKIIKNDKGSIEIESMYFEKFKVRLKEIIDMTLIDEDNFMTQVALNIIKKDSKTIGYLKVAQANKKVPHVLENLRIGGQASFGCNIGSHNPKSKILQDFGWMLEQKPYVNIDDVINYVTKEDKKYDEYIQELAER